MNMEVNWRTSVVFGV